MSDPRLDLRRRARRRESPRRLAYHDRRIVMAIVFRARDARPGHHACLSRVPTLTVGAESLLEALLPPSLLPAPQVREAARPRGSFNAYGPAHFSRESSAAIPDAAWLLTRLLPRPRRARPLGGHAASRIRASTNGSLHGGKFNLRQERKKQETSKDRGRHQHPNTR